MPLLVAVADYNIAYLYYLRGEYTRSIELYRRRARIAARSATPTARRCATWTSRRCTWS